MLVYKNMKVLPAKVEKLKAKIKDSKKATRVEKATNKLIVLLNDKNDLVRRGAIETIGVLKIKKAIPKLITCTDDPRDDSVRSAACVILGHLRAKEAINSLIYILTELDTGGVNFGVETLTEFQERQWIQFTDTGVGLYAAIALRELGEKNWINCFKGTSSAQEYLNNLALSKDPRIMDAFVKRINFPFTSDIGRMAYAIALTKTGDEKYLGLPAKLTMKNLGFSGGVVFT